MLFCMRIIKRVHNYRECLKNIYVYVKRYHIVSKIKFWYFVKWFGTNNSTKCCTNHKLLIKYKSINCINFRRAVIESSLFPLDFFLKLF